MKIIITGVESKLKNNDCSLREMRILKGEIYEVIRFEHEINADGDFIEVPIIMNNDGETAYVNINEFEVIEE